jgi:hypothetical protein
MPAYLNIVVIARIKNALYKLIIIINYNITI